MRGNPELVALRNAYCLTAFLILISSFVGCAAGSCLSYGHSCWGAHGKRSGVVHSMENTVAGGNRRIAVGSATPFGERWLFSRLLNRQLEQLPPRGRIFTERQSPISQPLNDELDTPTSNAANVKHSMAAGKVIEGADIRDMPKNEQRINDDEPSDIFLIPQRKDFINDDDQAIKFRLYKILKNLDENLK